MSVPYFIEDLRNEYSNDFFRTFANAEDGDGTVLTYSFLTSVPAGTTNYHGDPAASFQEYSDAEKATVRQALAVFGTVANVKFEEASGTTDVKFGQFNISGNVAGYSAYPQFDKRTNEISHGADRGDVWLDVGAIEGNLSLVLHEVGHSLGLKHPFDTLDPGNPHVLPTAEDNTDYTVMSYTGGTHFPIDTLRIYDVIALQSIYGPAKLRMGDDTYEFGKDKLIWDGGGKDTITAATAADGVTIDLNDGSWNYIGTKADSFIDDSKGVQVYLGNFTRIENLIGSSHDDHLTGNRLGNQITGGKGADTVDGGSGKDHLTGSAGGDMLSGGKNADTFVFLTLKDSTLALAGRDEIDDFHHSQHDKLDLSHLDADSHTKDNQDFSFIGADQFSRHAGELRTSSKNGDTLVSGDVTGDGKADFSFLIAGDLHLVKGDFAL
jgi:hypothetical protein